MIAIIGAGGHAKCVYECLLQQNQEVFGFFDDDPVKIGQEIINGISVIGTSLEIASYQEITGLFIAIGDNRNRLEKHTIFKEKGLSFPNVMHDKAYISRFAEVGVGNFFMGSAIVNPGSRIKNCCIINTAATIGHDCFLKDGVQIGPGVNLSGGCSIEEGAFIGIGAKLAPGVKVGSWAVVGAGSVVLNDVPERTFVCGIPAKVSRKNIS